MNTTTKTLFTLLTTLVLPVGCFDGVEPREDDDAGMEGGSEEGGESGEDDGEPAPLPEPAAGNAMIRVIHGAPGAPAVDVYAKGSTDPLIKELAYGQATMWLEVPAATYEFEIRAAGSSPFDAPAYSTGALELADGAMVSALAAGQLGSQGDDAFRVIPLVEDWDDAAIDETQVRIVHAGSDAPAVSIDVHDDGSDEVEGLARFADTGAAGVGVPAKTALQLAIGAGGERVTGFTTPELPEGEKLLVIATGLLGQLPRQSEGFALLVVGSQGSLGFIKQNPVVYALHASPDAPEVDLCAGDVVLASHLEFGKLASTQVPPGAYAIDFYASPSNCAGTPVTTDETPELEAGERYIAIATGEVVPEAGEPPLQLVAFREGFDLDSPEAAIFNVVHAATAPSVDVGLVTGTTIEGGNLLQAGLKWPQISETFAVQPFTYQIGLAASGSPMPLTPVASFHVDAYAGLRSFVVAAGDLAPDGAEAGFRLLAVDTATAPWSVTTYQ
jgi:Domain of unknown function (DUF4397)